MGSDTRPMKTLLLVILTKNVAVTFWSGMVLDISVLRMIIGTPPSSDTCKEKTDHEKS